MREYPQYEKSVPRDWAETAIFAIFAATFIRMFLIEAYVIPSSSMEGSLLVGDYMFVSKTSFGMRTPNTPLMLPLVHNTVPFLGTESYLDWLKLPYYRLNVPFLSGKVERYDAVVFNFPEGDTIAYAQETPAIMSMVSGNPSSYDYFFGAMPRTHYYGHVRSFGRKGVEDNFKIIQRPVDKQDHYIKRCVGLPGDKIEVRDRMLFVNDKPAEKAQKQQFRYTAVTKEHINTDKLDEMGIEWNMQQEDPRTTQIEANNITMHLHQSQFDEIRTWKEIDTIYVNSDSKEQIEPNVFPHDTAHFKFNMDNYGPVLLPKKGTTINLTAENIALFKRLITTYEHNSLEIVNGKFKINGAETTTYTPKMDYYWMMGDNRHNSEDSRVWGYVPEDHIVGKPLFIWMSRDQKSGRIRWERLFTGARKM
jgi:signal peptidase I